MSLITTTKKMKGDYILFDTGKVDNNNQPITAKVNIKDIWSVNLSYTIGSHISYIASLKNTLQPILEYNIIGEEQECQYILSN